jgi:hypothetical protein
MPLTGQAKTDYQRRYMRNRRAKQAAAKPTPVSVQRCDFCGQPKSGMLVGSRDGFAKICEACVMEAVEVIRRSRPAKREGSP